jgi:hypothetical protein
MKKLLPLLCAVVLAATTLTLTMTAADAPKQKTLRHVVNFKFKATATEAQIKEVVDAFRALKTRIPEIRAFEWGTNNSPEKLDKGFTHCFILTFHSEQDREIYLPHPDHKAFGAKLGPVLEDVFVIDYWAQE